MESNFVHEEDLPRFLASDLDRYFPIVVQKYQHRLPWQRIDAEGI